MILSVRNLSKSFEPKQVLRGIDMDVPKGEIYALLGSSGSGKSVLLRCILGLIHPDQGEIWIEGIDTVRLNARDRFKLRLKFGMLFQNGALFDSMSVRENVAFTLVEHTRLTRGEIDRRVEECLELVGLSGSGDEFPEVLSGGMKKRVALARAIALKPGILLFDEPTSGLDPVTRDVINALMVQLKRLLKVTCVIVTHDIESAFQVADRIGLINDGKIHFSGGPGDFKRSEDTIVKAFVRRPKH